MAHSRSRAEVVAERVECLFQDVPDPVKRYRLLVELQDDEFDAVRRETIEQIVGQHRQDD